MEKSQANFLESRVTVKSSECTCPRKSERAGEAHAPGPPRSVGSFCRALGASRAPALGSSPGPLAGAAPWPLSGKACAWLRSRRGLRGPLGPLCPVTRARCSSPCGIPSTPRLSERSQRDRVATFPTRVAVPEEGVGASRSAEETGKGSGVQ